MIPIDSTAALSSSLGPQAEFLGTQAKSGDIRQQQQAASQFESLFISLLLKEMRQTIGQDGLFGGDSSDVYGAMFDQYLGEHLAESGALGIGKLINQYVNVAKSA